MLVLEGATKSDRVLIRRIARRAVKLAASLNVPYEQIEAEMDLTATHLSGCPLRLRDLAAAPDFDFSHDVLGIRRHLSRETGELGGCFVPRFAKPQRD